MKTMHEMGKIIKILHTDTMHNTHEIHMYRTPTKRIVRVTLDLMCYDDLDIEDIDWKDILGLEGNEDVNVSIKDYTDIF